MTGPELSRALAVLGLSRAALAREIAALGGGKVHESTLYRNTMAEKVSPILAAYVALRLKQHTQEAYREATFADVLKGLRQAGA